MHRKTHSLPEFPRSPTPGRRSWSPEGSSNNDKKKDLNKLLQQLEKQMDHLNQETSELHKRMGSLLAKDRHWLLKFSKRVCVLYSLSAGICVFSHKFLEKLQLHKIFDFTKGLPSAYKFFITATTFISESKLPAYTAHSIKLSGPYFLGWFLLMQEDKEFKWSIFGLGLNIIWSMVVAYWFKVLPWYNSFNVFLHIVYLLVRFRVKRRNFKRILDTEKDETDTKETHPDN